MPEAEAEEAALEKAWAARRKRRTRFGEEIRRERERRASWRGAQMSGRRFRRGVNTHQRARLRPQRPRHLRLQTAAAACRLQALGRPRARGLSTRLLCLPHCQRAGRPPRGCRHCAKAIPALCRAHRGRRRTLPGAAAQEWLHACWSDQDRCAKWSGWEGNCCKTPGGSLLLGGPWVERLWPNASAPTGWLFPV